MYTNLTDFQLKHGYKNDVILLRSSQQNYHFSIRKKKRYSVYYLKLACRLTRGTYHNIQVNNNNNNQIKMNDISKNIKNNKEIGFKKQKRE